MLTRAGFCNDPFFAHAFGEQDLAHRVIDLMRTGVAEVFALEINFRPAELGGHALSKVKRCRAADIFAQIIIEFFFKRRIFARLLINFGQLIERLHEGLGHKHSAVRSEVPLFIWLGCFHGEKDRPSPFLFPQKGVLFLICTNTPIV